MPESFDEAFPGGFEECVRTLSDEDSVDDPEALCGWLQENGFAAIQEAEPDNVLSSLEVEYVSVVDEPAQDSEWLVAKSAQADPDAFDPTDDPLRDGEFVVNKQTADPERKVWAAVLIPGETDKQGDLVPGPEIERAAHNYLKHYRKVDEDHDLVDGSGEPIESYVLKQETTFDMPDGSGERTYPEGTWVMGVQLTDDAWKRVESGELTGFSIYGGAASLEPDELLTAKQREVLLSMDTDEQTQKAVDPEDLIAAVEAWSEATGGDPADATAAELVEWVQENPDYDDPDTSDEEGEEPEADGSDMDEDDEQESSKESETPGDGGDSDGGDESEQEKTDMGDEPTDDGAEEQNEKLDELLEKTNSVQESVEETRKSVESVEERVDELENEVFEKDEGGDDEDAPEGDSLDEEEVEEVAADAAEKAAESVLKSAFGVDEDEEFDEDADLGEVVRKGSRFPDPDHEQDDDSISLDYSGVVGEEEA